MLLPTVMLLSSFILLLLQERFCEDVSFTVMSRYRLQHLSKFSFFNFYLTNVTHNLFDSTEEEPNFLPTSQSRREE